GDRLRRDPRRGPPARAHAERPEEEPRRQARRHPARAPQEPRARWGRGRGLSPRGRQRLGRVGSRLLGAPSWGPPFPFPSLLSISLGQGSKERDEREERQGRKVSFLVVASFALFALIAFFGPLTREHPRSESPKREPRACVAR